MSRLPPSDYEEHASGALDPPPGQKPFQFTLAALLLLILACAAGLAIYKSLPSRVPTARTSVVRLELRLLANSLQKFENVFGGFPPPDLTPSPERRSFVLRAFPRISPAGLASLPKRLSPAEALVFWLGGYWDGQSMMGFAADRRNPFVPPGKANSFPRLPPIFEFDETRLHDRDGDGFPEYYPADPKKTAPYVGFFADTKGNYSGSYRHPGTAGVAVPYRSDDGGFVNPDSFQLIWAGLDNDFGSTTKRYVPSGKGYSKGDFDNQANFSPFSQLGDAVEAASQKSGGS